MASKTKVKAVEQELTVGETVISDNKLKYNEENIKMAPNT